MLQPQSIASLVLIMFNEIEAWNMSMNITWHYILMTSDRSFPSHVIVAIMSTGVFYLMCLKITHKHLYLLLTKKSLADLGS